jgi:hypothetical protein
MSKMYVMDIVGAGVYTNPMSDDTLNQCTQALDERLGMGGFGGFLYTSCDGLVRDTATASGGEGTRSINCILDGITWVGSTVPSDADTAAMCSAVRARLLEIGDWPLITSVGEIRVNMWAADPE